MPPAFNLSQDQTLQFKPVTVFGPSLNRSLTQRTDEVFNHLSMKKPSFHYCVRLLILLLFTGSENPATHSASSAHTYRLLVFKDRSANSAAPEPPGTTSSASLRLQQRNEIMENFRYAVNRFLTLISNPFTPPEASPLM